MATSTGPRTLDLAHELFEVVTQICLSTLRGRRRLGDLKEVEFLTLAILHANGTMIVGDIQRILGILPAQMSRIIRALETRERPLIACRINVQDKRKIDVVLTPSGRAAFLEHQGARVKAIAGMLEKLAPDDREQLHELLTKIGEALEMPQHSAS